VIDLGARLRESDRCLVGTWVKLSAGETVELMALAGFDFVVIDLEHGTLTMEHASRHIAAAAARGVAPLVRVPDHGQSSIQRVLDAGASGVLVPHVDDADEALRVSRMLRFEPRGTRGFGATSRAGQWGALPREEYLRRGNEQAMFIPQIECVQAVDALPDMLAHADVSAVFLGPGDLSVSLGVPDDHPRVLAAMDQVVAAARAAGVPCGTAIGNDPARLASLAARGFDFVMIGNDASFLGAAARGAVDASLAALGAG